jgi:hypothetical protein
MTLNKYPPVIRGKHFEKSIGFMRIGKFTFMGVGCYALCKAHRVLHQVCSPGTLVRKTTRFLHGKMKPRNVRFGLRHPDLVIARTIYNIYKQFSWILGFSPMVVCVLLHPKEAGGGLELFLGSFWYLGVGQNRLELCWDELEGISIKMVCSMGHDSIICRLVDLEIWLSFFMQHIMGNGWSFHISYWD